MIGIKIKIVAANLVPLTKAMRKPETTEDREKIRVLAFWPMALWTTSKMSPI
jgi:hypothetical protein